MQHTPVSNNSKRLEEPAESLWTDLIEADAGESERYTEAHSDGDTPQAKDAKEAPSELLAIRNFVSGLIAFAFAVSYFVKPAELAIFAFSVLVVPISLAMSNRGSISRLKADQVYYTIAAFFVATAFVAETPKRKQYSYQIGMDSLRDRLREFEEDLRLSREIASREQEFSNSTRDAFARKHAALREMWSFCADSYRGRVIEFQSLNKDIPWKNLFEAIGFERKNGNSTGIEFHCIHALATIDRREWAEATKIDSINSYTPLAKFAELAEVGEVQIGGVKLGFLNINSALFGDYEMMNAPQHAQRLEVGIGRVKQELKELQDKAVADTPSSLSLFLSGILQFAWPFALISLLGLKLARTSR